MSPTGKKVEDDMGWDEPSRPAKRTRVAVACQRCKTRKQKCDGKQPTCGNCKNLPVTCHYIVPSKTIPHATYQYIKALEARVVELENTVAAAGLPDSGKDVWDNVMHSDTHPDSARSRTSRSTPQAQEDTQTMEATQYLKDLSLHAGGGFVGDESSNVAVGQMFRSIAQTNFAATTADFPQIDAVDSQLEVMSDPLADIPHDLADTLLNGYLKHISTRWVILYRPHAIRLHNKNRRVGLDDPFEISTLNLIYATAGRILETVAGKRPSFYPGRYYQAALQHFDLILQRHDIQAVQTLLLHAVYCLRAPRGLGAWTYVGLATRLCIALGLHRRIPSDRATLAIEVKKRVFWSCYCLDRQVSIMLGRPFAISDRDIDAELPLDISDGLSDAAIQAIPNPNPAHHESPSTSLSCFVHTTRLRRIESDIQQSVYRVDRYKPLPRSKIDEYLSALAEWRKQVPGEFGEMDSETYGYDGEYYYDFYYYQCLRLLLYPHLTRGQSDLIIKCADACGGICRTIDAIHRVATIPFTLVAIYAVFLSGLTLLYCLWLSPSHVYNMKTVNDLDACSIVLLIIADRWPSAKRYSNAYEAIKQNVLSFLDSGNVAGGIPILGLDGHSPLRELGSGSLHPEGRRLYSQIMKDMTGGSQFQQEPILNPETQGFATSAIPTQDQQQRQPYMLPEQQIPQQLYPFYTSEYDPSQIYGNPGGVINLDTTEFDLNAISYTFPMANSGDALFTGGAMDSSGVFDLEGFMNAGSGSGSGSGSGGPGLG